MSNLHEFPMDYKRPPLVRVDPDAEPWLALDPGVQNGVTAASIHLAKQAHRRERESVIQSAMDVEGVALHQQNLIDSVAATRVANALPRDLSTLDRQDAGAVAVRLHDPRWQTVTRYHAADAILVELRKSQRLHGWYLADSDLKALADHLAGVSWMARFKVWTGQTRVTVRTWTRAALGMLRLEDEP